jgi:flagellar hook-length control protein FliK
MTNLPITTSAAQTAAVSKQTTNAADTGSAPGNQPFGEVLARQIKEPTAKDTKADDKLAVDALTQLVTDATDSKKIAGDIKKTDLKKVTDDVNKPDALATDGTTVLPADMLAALLPQAMNAASATSANTKADSATGTAQDQRGIAALKVEASAVGKIDAAAKITTGTNPGTQDKEPAFATTLSEAANRTASTVELNAAAREAISAASRQSTASPQSNAAALASLQNTAASIAAPVVQPVQVTINAPVTQDKWADEFSQKITWLASSNKDQTAELHLNPPQLGPLDVVIKVSGDQATALFTSPHAAVRDAIEQAMPRLREMMADNGIMLGNATVSDQAPRDPGQSGTQRSSVPTGNGIHDTSAASTSADRASPISRHNGIVDTFA